MKPAARIGDMHTCPMVTGTVPHVGGPILPPCAVTVTIGGIPAARVGDMATCVGPPDVIALGSMGVFIEGKPAARLGDRTAHGGVIVAGCPTVLVGDICGGAASLQGLTMSAARAAGAPFTKAKCDGAPASDQPTDEFLGGVVDWLSSKLFKKADPGVETYEVGVQIKGSPEFRKQTRESLDRLKATPTGANLLSTISSSGKAVTIEETKKTNGYCKGLSSEANRKSDGTPGSGSGSLISFNPNFKPGGLPNEVVLGHEMIHATHNAQGIRETGKTGGVKDEELQTVGLPPFPATGLTENSLRDDLKIAKRTRY